MLKEPVDVCIYVCTYCDMDRWHDSGAYFVWRAATQSQALTFAPQPSPHVCNQDGSPAGALRRPDWMSGRLHLQWKAALTILAEGACIGEE